MAEREETAGNASVRLAKALTDLADCGHTQAQIAGEIGYDPGTLSRMKRGKQAVSKRAARRIEKLYGYSASWLLHGEGDMRVGEAPGAYEGAGVEVAAGFRQEDVDAGSEANGRTVIMQVRLVPQCPQCKSDIQSGATVCPHCRTEGLKYPRIEVTKQ